LISPPQALPQARIPPPPLAPAISKTSQTRRIENPFKEKTKEIVSPSLPLEETSEYYQRLKMAMESAQEEEHFSQKTTTPLSSGSTLCLDVNALLESGDQELIDLFLDEEDDFLK
jgi:hypothetical protein